MISRRCDAAVQNSVGGVKTHLSGCQLGCRKIEFEAELLIVTTKILLLQTLQFEDHVRCWWTETGGGHTVNLLTLQLYQMTTSWDISQQQRNGEETRGFSEICFCLLCFHLLLLLQLQHSLLCFLSSALRFLLECISTDNTKVKLPFLFTSKLQFRNLYYFWASILFSSI